MYMYTSRTPSPFHPHQSHLRRETAVSGLEQEAVAGEPGEEDNVEDYQPLGQGTCKRGDKGVGHSEIESAVHDYV